MLNYQRVLHFQTDPDHPYIPVDPRTFWISVAWIRVAVFLQPQKYLDPLRGPHKCSFSQVYKRIPTFHHSFFLYFFSISQLLGIKMSTVIPMEITQLHPQEIERHEHRTHPYTPQLFKPTRYHLHSPDNIHPTQVLEDECPIKKLGPRRLIEQRSKSKGWLIGIPVMDCDKHQYICLLGSITPNHQSTGVSPSHCSIYWRIYQRQTIYIDVFWTSSSQVILEHCSCRTLRLTKVDMYNPWLVFLGERFSMYLKNYWRVK